MSNITNQREWIREYNDQHREQFNPCLYDRSDDEIINALKMMVLSCERDLYYTIKVMDFQVIRDYDEIRRTLYNHEQNKINKKNRGNNKNVENKYAFIDLKDSDILLLVINYFISVTEEDGKATSDTLEVIIKVPRLIDNYYYRISGKLYMAAFQIVDGSTYNNTNSNSKKQQVTFKPMFMPTRIYRNIFEVIDYNGCPVKYVAYTSRIFIDKNIPVVEYFLAEFGLIGALQFLELSDVILIKNTPSDNDEVYCFNQNDMFIEVPKFVFDRDTMVQCTTMAIYNRSKDLKYNDVFDQNTWIMQLASRFNSKPTIEKGLSILNSLESIYDMSMHNSIHLPENEKHDIYCVLRWMIRNYASLRLKDNADISTKRIRRGEYIAAIYAAKMSKGIYRVSDNQRKISCDTIKRYIYIDPDFLLKNMVKDKLVSFRDHSNDNDGVAALKYSYKGISGLGENSGSAVPDSYRHLHPSHITRVDPDTSSATDPGLTGIICPLAKINNFSFASKDFVEPNSWKEEFTQLMEEYKSIKGRTEIMIFEKSLNNIFTTDSKAERELMMLESCLQQQQTAIDAIARAEMDSKTNIMTTLDDNTIIMYNEALQ